MVPRIFILMQKDNTEKSTAIKVFIRVRPLVGAELGTNEVVSVEEDVRIPLARKKLSKSQLTPFQSSKPNLIKPLPRRRAKRKFFNTFAAIFAKFRRVTTSQSSPTVRLGREKPTPCSVATGKTPSLNISKRNSTKTPFFKTSSQIRTTQG